MKEVPALTPPCSPPIDASLGVGMVGGVKALILLLVVGGGGSSAIRQYRPRYIHPPC